ncbi:hypothetical protein NPIL_652111 [Nephila pilipes]|uniref:Uncharacterized protein n=1 Tax=Nephila pilipes TaxID=299642 RepID=A0A8X6QKD6_NEPPI|nr:hypothetical protein NPIL_652111 [Nephila pilipes]
MDTLSQLEDSTVSSDGMACSQKVAENETVLNSTCPGRQTVIFSVIERQHDSPKVNAVFAIQDISGTVLFYSLNEVLRQMFALTCQSNGWCHS